jgi:protoporphyrinogen/coproporphyrinogen III oxidase
MAGFFSEQVTRGLESGRRNVAVVGAGAAGLSAAWRLISGGHEVTLFDARAAPGGRMRTDDLDGVAFDAAVQLVGSNYTQLFQLARSLNVAGQLVPSPGRDAVWRNGRAHPLSYGSIARMVTSSALPTGLKLRLGTKYLPFLARHSDLDLHDLPRTGGTELDSEPIGDWGKRELGEDFVDLLAYPLLGAYYGSAPENTSPALYHALARVGMDVSLYSARSGMGALAAQIAEALAARGATLRYSTRIEGFNSADGRVVLHGPAAAESYDAAVLAVPADGALRLLPDGWISEWLAEVQLAPTCTLALALERPASANYFGLSWPRGAEAHAVVAVCVQEQKGSDLVPEGRGALLVLPAPDQARSLSTLAPNEVLDRLLPDVERILPGTRLAISRARVTYFPEGNPVFYPGYIRHLQRFRPELLPERTALAGDYLVAPTVEGAVRSGIQAADRLLEDFKS